MIRVLCLECGSMVVPVIGDDGKIYYSAHYIPGGVDSAGFCLNIAKVPDQILDRMKLVDCDRG